MNRAAAVALTVLVVLCAYQWRAARAMKAEIQALRSGTATELRRETLRQFDEAHHDEAQRAVTWLNEYYSAPEGLQRSQGLCHDGKLDADGLVVWLFDRYMRARADGAPEGLARQQVADAIRRSDEWRALHRSP
jgi:hypothetical protein